MSDWPDKINKIKRKKNTEAPVRRVSSREVISEEAAFTLDTEDIITDEDPKEVSNAEEVMADIFPEPEEEPQPWKQPEEKPQPEKELQLGNTSEEETQKSTRIANGRERRGARRHPYYPGGAEPKKEAEKPKIKILRIGVILDATPSFTTVYPKIFDVLVTLLEGMKIAREEYKGVNIQYALTILRDRPESVCFSDETFFTTSEQEVKKILEEMKFYGGSADGYEDLNAAVREQLFVLNSTEDAETVDKGLLLFTDSLPADDIYMPRFTSREPGKYGAFTNYGLRFARIYANTKEYMPVFRIVDSYGNLVENEKNTQVSGSLAALLEKEPWETAADVQKMINEILNQASIG